MFKAEKILLSLIMLTVNHLCHSLTLVTEEEAKLPDLETVVSARAISRGPEIRLVSPDTSLGTIRSPFKLRVLFEPHGGSKIDPSSIQVFYLKDPIVDLVNRISTGLTANGINIDNTELPPGNHKFRISVNDLDGHQSSSIIQLTVPK